MSGNMPPIGTIRPHGSCCGSLPPSSLSGEPLDTSGTRAPRSGRSSGRAAGRSSVHSSWFGRGRVAWAHGTAKRGMCTKTTETYSATNPRRSWRSRWKATRMMSRVRALSCSIEFDSRPDRLQGERTNALQGSGRSYEGAGSTGRSGEALRIVYRDWRLTNRPFGRRDPNAGQRREDAQSFGTALVAALLGGLSEAIEKNNQALFTALGR